ncbi:hypothetical protein GW17_00009512 [Ensete ventricosum]|nr:hypothetical protein GW17_00009512 [Ensete ventricosum]
MPCSKAVLSFSPQEKSGHPFLPLPIVFPYKTDGISSPLLPHLCPSLSSSTPISSSSSPQGEAPHPLRIEIVMQ